MRLSSLKVQNVRIHSDYSLALNPSVNLITGLNGSGKTSLLEAIYIALRGSSFRGSDNDILRQGTDWYRIEVESDEGRRIVKYDTTKTSGKKQYDINSKIFYRLSYDNKYPVVLFDPDELRLISGSPSRRRQFIDRLIGQFDPEYALSHRRYERALRQRNILLKQSRIDRDNLFVWDVSLSKYGAYLVSRRLLVLEQLESRLGAVYSDISGTKDKVSIRYSDLSTKQTEQSILSSLHKSSERDKLLGFTSIGPHRHDILFSINNKPAASAASRGETRTLVLALKFLEVDIIEDHLDRLPIILLDDVFSELDQTRQAALMERFSSYQTVITSVSAGKTKNTAIKLGV